MAEVVTNSGDVMAGIALTSDEEVSASILGVLLEEALDEAVEVLSDLILISVVVEDRGALGETRANGLINIDQVRHLIPSLSMGREGHVIVDGVGTVLVEDGELGGAARTTGEPHDEGISGGALLGLEEPEEHIITVLHGDETSLVLLVKEERVLLGEGRGKESSHSY